MYETLADDIFRYLYVRVHDRQLAEDLTADTFMRALKSLERFDFAQPRPWLYKIASNLLTDHWRKRKPEALDDPEALASEDDGLADVADRALTRARLQAVVDKLPPRERTVVTMRFQLGYSARQTGERLGITESNVRIIQHRALKKLRGYLS